MPFQAEIIAIGSELTTGAKLDTNSQWLSLELAAIGIPVEYHTTVADNLEAMIGVLRDAVNRSEVVLITGGLGPTLDDLTRQALAELVQVELVLDEPSLEFIKALFAQRRREMPERNIIQAMFPKGSAPIRNPRGSAPGIWMEVPRKGSDTPAKVAAMPGVPSEMKFMFHNEVLPRLSGGGRVIRRARINCFGVGESHAEEMLGDVTARGRDPEVGITVHEATITLRITASAATADDCEAKIAATRALIRERMGDLVFGEEDEELQHVVVRMLSERGLTLATAECGTGGLLASWLTDVPGYEQCYRGGLLAPTAAALTDLVSPGPADRAGPSHALQPEERAAWMAAACRSRFGADFALAVTECPRYNPDDVTAAAPRAFVALAEADQQCTLEQTLAGDPAIIKSRTAKAALNLLRLRLLPAPRVS
jgi:nicotinamide-nucleotide amidase